MASRKHNFSLEKCYEIAFAENHKRHWSRVFYDSARNKGYKYAARAHRPGCVTGFDSDADLRTFSDERELYKLPFVRRWESREDFDKWELSPYTDDGEHLLSAHLKNGEHWVVAYFMRLNPRK